MRLSLHASPHPVIRIAVFIVLAGALTLGNVNTLPLAAMAVALAYGMTANAARFAVNLPLYTTSNCARGINPRACSRGRITVLPLENPPSPCPRSKPRGISRLNPLYAALNMIRRMRWLFLSLFIIYGWFTPGSPLPLTLPVSMLAWLPTMQGLEEAAVRIASLVIVVLAVHLLLHITSREELLGAILWWLKQLGYAGIAHQRLAVRMALVLETVPKMQPLIQEALDGHRQVNLSNAGQVAAALYHNVLNHAEQQTCHTIEIPTVTSPPVWQWLFPIGMGAALGWVAF